MRFGDTRIEGKSPLRMAAEAADWLPKKPKAMSWLIVQYGFWSRKDENSATSDSDVDMTFLPSSRPYILALGGEKAYKENVVLDIKNDKCKSLTRLQQINKQSLATS